MNFHIRLADIVLSGVELPDNKWNLTIMDLHECKSDEVIADRVECGAILMLAMAGEDLLDINTNLHTDLMVLVNGLLERSEVRPIP